MRKSTLSAVVVAVAASALTFGSAQAGERGRGEFERVCAPIRTGPRTKPNSLNFWPSA